MYSNLSKRKKRGFSLVELMIAVVIIGLLAAIAVPIYKSNVMKAKMSEADVVLSSIRAELRIYQYEYGEFPNEVHNNMIIGAGWNNIKDGELTRKYFSDESYTYRSANRQAYILNCSKGDVLDRDRTLNEAGVFSFD